MIGITLESLILALKHEFRVLMHVRQCHSGSRARLIIGKDLRYDSESKRVYFDRSEYYDKKGRENNPKRGITYTDEQLLTYVKNIYTVLLTRGILGTYVYVCDPGLKKYLMRYI